MRKTDKLIIDKNLLETLCGYQADLGEIASLLKVTQKNVKDYVKTEYNLNFKEFYSKYSSAGKVKLRENMFLLSKKSPDMAKYLSEKYLNTVQNMSPTVQNPTDTGQSPGNVSKKVMETLQKDPEFLALKLQHRSFLLNYLVCKNATDSALKAEYPKSSAYSQGARLLKNAKISRLIAKYSEMEAELAGDEKEQLIDELHQIKNKAIEHFTFPGMPSAAISAISRISSMRGFEAPKEIKGTLSVVDVLKTQEDEDMIDLD